MLKVKLVTSYIFKIHKVNTITTVGTLNEVKRVLVYYLISYQKLSLKN